MNKYGWYSVRIAADVVMAVSAIALFMYCYIVFDSTQLEIKIYSAEKHGGLSDIFLLGAIIGIFVFAVVSFAAWDIQLNMQIRKLQNPLKL